MSETPKLKDPDDVDDYTWDWADMLGDGETIIDHDITDVVGITVGAHEVVNDGTAVVARISGGTIWKPASATCHIKTSTGREKDRTMRFTITNR